MLEKSIIANTVSKAFLVLFGIKGVTTDNPTQLAKILTNTYNGYVHYTKDPIKDKSLGPSMFGFLFSFLIYKYLEPFNVPSRKEPPAYRPPLVVDSSLPETGSSQISKKPKKISPKISSLEASSNRPGNYYPSSSHNLLFGDLEEGNGPSVTSDSPLIVDQQSYQSLKFGSPTRHLFGISRLMTEARFMELVEMDVPFWNANFVDPTDDEPTHPFYQYVKANYSDIIDEHYPNRGNGAHVDNKRSTKVWQDVYTEMLMITDPPSNVYEAFADFFGEHIRLLGETPGCLCHTFKEALNAHHHYKVFKKAKLGAMRMAFIFAYLIWEQKNPNNKMQIIDNSGEQSISAAQTIAPPSNATQSRKRTIDSNLPTEKIHSGKNFDPNYYQKFVNVWQMPTNESNVQNRPISSADRNRPAKKFHTNKNLGPHNIPKFVDIQTLPNNLPSTTTSGSNVQNIPESNLHPSTTHDYLGSVVPEVPQPNVQRISDHNPSKKQKLPTPSDSPTIYEDNPHRSDFLNRTLYGVDDFLDEDSSE
jgi:hypothetical protein